MERNVIAKNTTIIGDIKAIGDFRIDGVLEGSLKTNGRVIIAAEAIVKGDVEASNADIEGEFSGNLKVEKILTVKTIAKISGDVVVGKLSIEPGATFNASCIMTGTAKVQKKEHEKPKPIKKTFK
jgi:cytoskeletal protein CcmA (bactofilin family)